MKPGAAIFLAVYLSVLAFLFALTAIGGLAP